MSYSEVAHFYGRDAWTPDLGDRLDEGSIHEHQNGRPLLSVVVVHRTGDHMPGEGFFSLARRLNLLHPDDDDAIFFGQELERCWEFWRRVQQT